MTTESEVQEHILLRRCCPGVSEFPLGGQHAHLLQEIKQRLSGLWTELWPAPWFILYCVLHVCSCRMSGMHVCYTQQELGCVARDTVGTWSISTSKENWLREEEEEDLGCFQGSL